MAANLGGQTAMGEKRPPEAPPVADSADILKITPLGAGNEVGRSCIMIEYKNKTIMVGNLCRFGPWKSWTFD